MRKSRRPIIIASRRSPLARSQATAVGKAMARLHPRITVEYRWIESEADQNLNVALSEAGGKGLFARAIEQALLKGEADLAVHSLKDLPARPGAESAGLNIAAIPSRGDVRDCLITKDPQVTELLNLPQDAVVGTASPRRAAQLLRLRPDVRIELIRGNVETRLAKLRQPEANATQFDATFLAMAGLSRMGMTKKAAGHALDFEQMLPAAGQGALALQCRSDDHVTITRCLPLNDAAASAAVHAERAIVASLGGDCHSPIAVLVHSVGSELELWARVLSQDGKECIEVRHRTTPKSLGKLVKQVIGELDSRGARALLRAGMPGFGAKTLPRLTRV